MQGEIVALWMRFFKIPELVPPPTAPSSLGPPKHRGGYVEGGPSTLWKLGVLALFEYGTSNTNFVKK